MLHAGLHAGGWNPQLSTLEIELFPTRLAKLVRAHKEEQSEFQSDADYRAPRVAVDPIEQLSETPRIA